MKIKTWIKPASVLAIPLGLALAAAADDAVPGTLPPAATKPGVTYAADIKPILDNSCAKCHSGDKPRGHLKLDSLAGRTPEQGRYGLDATASQPGEHRPADAGTDRPVARVDRSGREIVRCLIFGGGMPRRRPHFRKSVRDGGTPSLPHYNGDNGARFCSRNFCCWRSSSFCSVSGMPGWLIFWVRPAICRTKN